MSEQSITKFVQQVSNDRELERRLDAAIAGSKDKQAALIAFAAQEGYSFDRKELAAIAAGSGALSDGALDQVAGGLNPQPLPPGGSFAMHRSYFMNFFSSRGIIIVGG